MLRDQVVLFPVNPKQFSSFRESFRTTKAKSDKDDALLLARMLFEHHRQMNAWKPDDESTPLLNRLCSTRRKWVELRTSLSQRLLDLVKSYFPVILLIADSKLYDHPLLLEILRKWPDPRELKRVNPKVLTALMTRHGVKNEAQQQDFDNGLKNAPIHSRNSTLLLVASLEAKTMVMQLAGCQELINHLDQEIKAVLAKHPDAVLFTPLRGAGAALAPRLLTAFGTDRSRFKNAEEVASYVGIAPVTKQSGKSCIVVRRRACSKYLLHTFHEFASAAAKWCPWSKAYYKLQQSKGMKRHAILRKLAYRWIRILFRVWQTRTPFDQNRYIQSLVVKNPENRSFLPPQNPEKRNQLA
ncbi:MAG: transposase [Planctomycetales bacterium]|nr:transposase [Planctomycetales bacterium]